MTRWTRRDLQIDKSTGHFLRFPKDPLVYLLSHIETVDGGDNDIVRLVSRHRTFADAKAAANRLPTDFDGKVSMEYFA
jgi:hypothetical protein